MKVIQRIQQSHPCEIEELLVVFVMGAIRGILEHHHVNEKIIAGLVECQTSFFQALAHKFLLTDLDRRK